MAAYRGFELKIVGAALVAGLATYVLPAPAVATTPTLMWSGAKRVQILCNVAGGPGINHIALTEKLCRDVTRIAAKGAPMPVATIAVGDPAVLAADAVSIIVQASVTIQGRDRLMSFSVRPYRSSSDQTAVLFGAPPRAATMLPSGGTSSALDAALTAALSETLPWQAHAQGPQPLPTRN